MRTIHRLIVLVALTLAFAMPLSAQINPDLIARAQDPNNWLNFTPDKEINEVAALVKANQNDPALLPLLRSMEWATSFVTASQANKVDDLLVEISNKGADLEQFGSNAERFMARIADRLLESGEYVAYHKLRERRMGVKYWLAAGPFKDNYAGDQHYNALPPELLIERNSTMPGAYGKLTWQNWHHPDPRHSNVSVGDFTRRSGNGFFLWTTLECSEALEGVLLDLRVNTGGVKAWIDGQLVFNRRPYADASRDDVAKVDLSKGSHSLVIKIGDDSDAWAAIVDPVTRLPIPSVTNSFPSSDADSFVLKGELPAASAPYRPHIAPFEAWLKANPSHDAADSVRLALAHLYLEDGEAEIAENYWHACKSWREAQGTKAKVFDYLYYQGWTVLATEGQRAKIRREALDYLVEHAEGEVMASLQLAKQHGEEGRERKAADSFEALIKRCDHWGVRWSYASFFESKGWAAEARDQRMIVVESMRKAGKEFPPSVLSFLQSDISERGEISELEDLLLLVNEIHGQHSYRASFLSDRIWRMKGYPIGPDGVVSAKREHMRAGYRSASVRRILAEAYEAHGKILDAQYALEEIPELYSVVPTSAVIELAEFYARHGKHKEALAAYKRVLEIDPSRREALDYLDYHHDKLGMIASPYNSVVTHDILDELKAEDFPKASGGYLLDEEVWVINHDGSYQSYEQKVIKILGLDGVDRFGRQRPQGKVTKVRTMLADGGEAEPSTVRGNAFEFPLVAPGNALHWITHNRSRTSAHKVLENINFYFAERDFSVPTALARLVVVAEPGTKLNWRRNNCDDVVFSETKAEDGRRVLTWEYRKPRSIESEFAMPSRDELLPYIEFTRGQNDWNSRVEEVRQRAKIVRPTWLVQERSDEIIREHVKSLKEGPKGSMAPPSTPKRPSGQSKARALYEWINQTIKVESGPNEAHLVLQENAGDREVLFRAMLVAQRIRFDDVYVMNRATNVRGERYLQSNASFRTHLFAIYEVNSLEPTYIQVSSRQAPFGYCDPSLAGARAVSVSLDGDWVQPIVLPKSLDQRMVDHTRYEFEISTDLSAKVSGVLTEHESGWETREDEREASEPERRRSLLGAISGDLSGFELKSFKSSDLEELGTPLIRGFEGTLKNCAVDLGDGKISIRPHLSNTAESLSQVIDKESRRFDMVLPFEWQDHDELRYKIPEGFALEELPEDFYLYAQPFTYWLTYELEGDEIVIQRHFEINQRRVSPTEYASFRSQIKSIGEAEKRQLIFKKVKK